MYCIEEQTCDIVTTFWRPPMIRRPGHCGPLVTPLAWQFATKCAAVKFAELWMSNHFSQLIEHNYVSLARYPECPTEDWWGKPCWLDPRESDPDHVQGLSGVTASPILLGPVLMCRQEIYLKLLLTVRYSNFSYICCPPALPRRKADMKMNEMNNIYVSLFTGLQKCSSSKWTSFLDG